MSDFTEEGKVPSLPSFEDFNSDNLADIGIDAGAKPSVSPLPEPPKPARVPVFEDREGVFELTDKGYGFVRAAEANFLASSKDIYVGVNEVRRYRLKTGDLLKFRADVSDKNRSGILVHIYFINGIDPDAAKNRTPFERLIPIFPNEKFVLVDDNDKNAPLTSRIVDLFAPIGKGQRGLIVAQPKTGKTTLLKEVANSILKHHPEVYMMILLIDERPEEVTDMKRSVNAKVLSSTFDESAEHHIKVSSMVYEHALRMVECGRDVVILLDSLTRLARAYNIVEPSSGKVLSGGVDPKALHKPKQFFGAARNIEGGGSLTIIATALVETGSKMDDFIFEEFKGTGNMELMLNRTLSNRHLFPAVDYLNSSTRRDDLLLPAYTVNRMWGLRNLLAKLPLEQQAECVLNGMDIYKTNDLFVENIDKQ